MVNNFPGSFIISLDYELMWGMIDVASPEGYGKTNVANVQYVIKRLTNLFSKYNIHATFATVGLIFCENKYDALKNVPTIQPTYSNTKLSPYNDYISKISSDSNNLYFDPNTINLLASSPNIEVGTHTFCHYYCLENGQNIEQFEADILKAIEIANKKGLSPKSIVFPRNNVNQAYLDVCLKHGIISYRGNAKRFYNSTHGKLSNFFNRINRLIDTYFNFYGSSTFDYSELACRPNSCINIPATRFLRPYNSKLWFLEWLKINRIKKEIRIAAKKNKLYHIWWHPHNFGTNIDKNMRALETILKEFQICQKKYGMVSLTMEEMALNISSWNTL